MLTEITLQPLGENLEEGKILEVKVAPGAVVAKDQPLVEIEAEKASVEVLAPEAGKVTQVLVHKGDTVKVGQTLCLIEHDGSGAGSGAAPPSPPAPPPPPSPQPQTPAPPSKPQALAPAPAIVAARQGEAPPVPAGPATRRLARELGVDLQQVPGTAPRGRITSEDVKAYVRQRIADGAPRAAVGAGQTAPPLPDFERWGPVERKPLEQLRHRTAEHLSLAWHLIPHVTQHDLADITELETFRKSQEGSGPKWTITALALKAAALVLREMPHFNSSIDLVKGQLILKRYCHIGVAVDTDRGLLVPVIRNVDQKSVVTLAAELAEMAQRARDKKLAVDDMRGGCFTITNLGGIGGTAFTPIVNYPEVAILGLARGRWQPLVREGQVVPRFLLPLSLSYDHRVIDGADGARFVRRIADLLENPLKMLLWA